MLAFYRIFVGSLSSAVNRGCVSFSHIHSKLSLWTSISNLGISELHCWRNFSKEKTKTAAYGAKLYYWVFRLDSVSHWPGLISARQWFLPQKYFWKLFSKNFSLFWNSKVFNIFLLKFPIFRLLTIRTYETIRYGNSPRGCWWQIAPGQIDPVCICLKQIQVCQRGLFFFFGFFVIETEFSHSAKIRNY